MSRNISVVWGMLLDSESSKEDNQVCSLDMLSEWEQFSKWDKPEVMWVMYVEGDGFGGRVSIRVCFIKEGGCFLASRVFTRMKLNSPISSVDIWGF